MKKITVEWIRCREGAQKCCRFENSSRAMYKVITLMKPALQNMKIDLEMKEVMLADGQSDISNTVLINGKNIEAVLGEKGPEKKSCPSCSELPGKEVWCRTFSFRGSILDSLTGEMLQEAIVAEISALRPSTTVQGETIASCSCKT